MDIKELDVIHKKLRRYRYFYYEMNQSLVSDYDYDILEKQYTEAADRLGISPEYRVDSFVGSDIRIPRSLLSFYRVDEKEEKPIERAMDDPIPNDLGQLSLF